MQKFLALAFVLLFSSLALAQTGPLPPDLACRWSAQLTAARPDASDAYMVPFDLDIERTPTGLRAALRNGGDRIDFSSAVQQGNELILRLDQYDAVLSAHCSPTPCNALQGEYVRQRGSSIARYAISAHCPGPQVAPTPKSRDSAPQRFSLAADWEFAFTDSAGKPDSEANAPAHFTADANHVEGTIAPISGDYGMLAGALPSGADAEFHLSRFDGVHALRLDGHLSLRTASKACFTSRPDARSTSWQHAHPRRRALRKPNASPRSRILPSLFASMVGMPPAPPSPKTIQPFVVRSCYWTSLEPGARTATMKLPLLQWLYAKFHARGLEIVGLSYEYATTPPAASA